MTTHSREGCTITDRGSLVEGSSMYCRMSQILCISRAISVWYVWQQCSTWIGVAPHAPVVHEGEQDEANKAHDVECVEDLQANQLSWHVQSLSKDCLFGTHISQVIIYLLHLCLIIHQERRWVGNSPQQGKHGRYKGLY